MIADILSAFGLIGFLVGIALLITNHQPDKRNFGRDHSRKAGLPFLPDEMNSYKRFEKSEGER